MAKHNPNNERIKRSYFTYLREARRYSGTTIDGVAKAISRFEEATGCRDFRQFHREQAVAFKRRLAEQNNLRTGDRLSTATIYSTVQALRSFFIWLAGQPGFRSRISYSDADYFNTSEREARIAKATRDLPVPTLEQIHCVLSVMPSETDVELRNRALIALCLLTGARDGALASLRLKHVDIEQGKLVQDAREVRTKFSKSFSTWFFPVGGDAQEIVTDWIEHLRQHLLWSDNDPLFPITRVDIGGSGHFEAVGLARKGWSNANPIRKIFREAFEAAELPYFNPHSFRKTLVQLALRRCQTAEEFKVWSQNLGHEGVLTTFTSYGSVSAGRQAELMRAFAVTAPEATEPDFAKRLARVEAVLLAAQRGSI